MPRKPSRWQFFIGVLPFFLTLGILEHISLSVRVADNRQRDRVDDAPTLEEEATSEHKRRNRNDTSLLYSSENVPFPKWNDPKGIQWEAIEAYIRHAAAHLMSGKDLLECRNDGCPQDMPNVLYIFGAHDISANNITFTIQLNGTPKTWVESRRRKKIGPGFSKRYPIMEELMDRSLQHLLSMNREAAMKHYPRLLQRIRPDDDGNNHTLLLGIPLLANFGDNRQCHFQNLKQESHDPNKPPVWHNVPVFTLAVPIDCQFAFPIPHPAALDTAKVYGDRWEFIMDRRDRSYPLWNKTGRAIWRGSPTGWPMNQQIPNTTYRAPQENQTLMLQYLWNKTRRATWRGLTMRQQMVYIANQLPQENQSLMLQVKGVLSMNNPTNTSTTLNNATFFFNVGFGKPFHKVVPTYMGPLIPRQSRIAFEDFAQYRVILDADGSSWSERFGPLLCLNSVVAKLDPDFVDWLWPRVQPNIHFVSVQKDSSNLWSALLPFLLPNNDPAFKRGQMLTRKAQEWCTAHITYPRMIQDFLESLEQYVECLDRGDGEWWIKWHELFLHDMPPTHHNWQAIPVKKVSAYFPLWREDDHPFNNSLY